MDMSGERRIAASQSQVWDALFDPECLRQCIPGCQSVERVSDTKFKATVALAIGPVKAKFAGEAALDDIDAPNSCRLSGTGSGGAAGFGKGDAKIQLRQDGDATVLTYTVHASVGGKIAQIGQRLIDSTAKKLADEFFERFAYLMSEQSPSVAKTQGEEQVAGPAPEKEPPTKGAARARVPQLSWVLLAAMVGLAAAAFAFY